MTPPHAASAVGLQRTETLIVSDLHLGLPGSRPIDMLELLERWRFERLILLGDVFHDFSFRHICADTWRLVRRIRELAHDRDAELVWLKGNHDRHLTPVVRTLTGLEMRESYRWSCDGRSYLAVHGDRFDRFVATHRRVSRQVSALYGFCQRHLSRSGDWPKRISRMHGSGRLGEEMARRAARYAHRRNADAIVCGHTHHPIHRRFEPSAGQARSVDYYNAGSWIDWPMSFVTVDAGGVRICPHAGGPEAA